MSTNKRRQLKRSKQNRNKSFFMSGFTSLHIMILDYLYFDWFLLTTVYQCFSMIVV